MKESGARANAAGGEKCSTRTETSMRESGWMIRTTGKENSCLVRTFIFSLYYLLWKINTQLHLCSSKWKLVWGLLERRQEEWQREILQFWKRPALCRFLGRRRSKMWNFMWIWKGQSPRAIKEYISKGSKKCAWYILHICVIYFQLIIPFLYLFLKASLGGLRAGFKGSSVSLSVLIDTPTDEE